MRYLLCLCLLALAVTVFAIDSNPKHLPVQVTVEPGTEPLIVQFEVPRAPYALNVRSTGGAVMLAYSSEAPIMVIVPPIHEATLCFAEQASDFPLYLGVANVSGRQRVSVVVTLVDYEDHCQSLLSDEEM